MVLLVLAAIWGAVIIQQVRSRVDVRPVDSIVDFRRQLSVLRRTSRPGAGWIVRRGTRGMAKSGSPNLIQP